MQNLTQAPSHNATAGGLHRLLDPLIDALLPLRQLGVKVEYLGRKRIGDCENVGSLDAFVPGGLPYSRPATAPAVHTTVDGAPVPRFATRSPAPWRGNFPGPWPCPCTRE